MFAAAANKYIECNGGGVRTSHLEPPLASEQAFRGHGPWAIERGGDSIMASAKGKVATSLVTGATGFVGHHLLGKLGKSVVLSRNVEAAREKLKAYHPQVVGWNPETEPAPGAAFAGVDVVYHLAGEPVAEGRWTAEKKRRLVDSRILGTRNLVDTLLKLKHKPRVLVAASAVGYYGDRGDEILEEPDKPGQGFLADLCVRWEREAMRAVEGGIRVVPVRIGVVLGKDGGALQKMLPVFRKGLGSALGSGAQYMPWVHVDDLVELFQFVAEHDSVVGPVNGTGPHPVTNREFTKALAKALRVPCFLPPVPGLAIKLMFGELGGVLLHSQQVLPRAAMRAGFRFHYSDLDAALQNIFPREDGTKRGTEQSHAPRSYLGTPTNH
jgi:uncharacterized protein (TIGR01777 family)